jgi:uncharacterized protein (TIGR02611 family)
VVAAKPTKPTLVERMQAERVRHRQRSKIVRIAYVVAGFVVLAAGIALLVAPGPAFVVIPFGLAMLSLEFAWAERLLARAVARSEQAKQAAADSTTKQRVLTAIAVLLTACGFVWWGLASDIPLLPV